VSCVSLTPPLGIPVRSCGGSTGTKATNPKINFAPSVASQTNSEMSSQEKWITSGASRLKAMQNRGFTFRAKQKASSMVTNVVYKKREGGGRSQCQPSKRPKIVGALLHDGS
jgi:hypothetical protein